jgi:8-oxo-dGTP pyrophosphatase MutT (NUDIX family)
MAQSYKVYIGNCTLYFSDSILELENCLSLTPQSNWQVWVGQLDLESDQCWQVAIGEKELHWHEFQDSFKCIAAAGGRVENEDDHILMIYRRDKWDLPKGKVDKGESIHQAAVREVMEECGLQYVERGVKLGVIYHMYFHKEKWVLKDTHWYKMRASKNEILIPQIEEDITAIEWVDPQTHPWKTNTFPSIEDVMSW